MSKFDFGQYFDNAPKEQDGERSTDPLKNILEEIEEKMARKESSGIDQEEAYRLFIEKHGSPDAFMKTVFPDMFMKYAEACHDVIAQMTRSQSFIDPAPAIAAGAIYMALDLHSKALVENDEGHGQDSLETKAKTMILTMGLNDILPDESPKDAMIVINALLNIVLSKFAHLTLQYEAQRLYNEDNA